MPWERGLLVLLGVSVLRGCATLPTGSSVMVLPAQGKPFEAFQPMTTRGTSNGDYEAYRATHLTDHVTLSRRSPRGQG
jgi:hypothetical protein